MTDISEVKNIPDTLSVTLALTDEIRAAMKEGITAPQSAQIFEIDSPEVAQTAANQLTVVKRSITKLEELRKGFIAPARQIIDNANSLFNPALQGFREAEFILKTQLAQWQDREQKRIAVENAAREEAARKARQEAEAKAAAERARAEEIAAAERRRAEEAEAERRRAEAEGNKRAAARAAAEAAQAQAKAAAVVENAEAKATEATLAAAAVATAPVEAPVKIAGVQMRDNWIAELAPGQTPDTAKRAVIAAIAAGRDDLVGLLDINDSAVKQLAKALKTSFSVPGFVARNAPIVAGSRGRA